MERLTQYRQDRENREKWTAALKTGRIEKDLIAFIVFNNTFFKLGQLK